MNNIKFVFVSIVTVAILLLQNVLPVSAISESNEKTLENVSYEGNILLRMPGAFEYEWFPKDFKVPEHSLGYVIPNSVNPLATNSLLLIGSHSIIVYPSATFRLIDNGIIPLTGRFEFNTELESHKILINTRKCNGEYNFGNLLIEATPDAGLYFALTGEGKAWFKDNLLEIFEMKQPMEIFFPLYGKTVSGKRLSSFWKEAPQSFGRLR